MKKSINLLLLVLSLTSWAQPSDSYIANLIDTAGKAPGIAIVIIKDNHWVYECEIGTADLALHKNITRKTDFEIGEIGATVIATSVMQLRDRGLLSLDNNINTYLPFPFKNFFHPADSVTLRMLLTNTASTFDAVPTLASLTVHGDSPISLDSIIRNYFNPGGIYYDGPGNFLDNVPGTYFKSSSMAYATAAYIVERVTGDKFSHYCDTAIFRKLCMENTSYLLSGITDTGTIARPYKHNSGGYIDLGLLGLPHYPGWQVRTNLTALARYMDMCLQKGNYNGTKILDSNSVNEMLTSSPVASGQGLGFRNEVIGPGHVVWGSQGFVNGYSATMFMNHLTKTGVIILTNGIPLANKVYSLLDTLYKYGLTITPAATDIFPDCEGTAATPAIAVINPEISVFPNPTNSETTIATSEAGFAVLTDIQGQRKGTYLLKPGNNIIQMQAMLPPGMYLVSVHGSDGALLSVKKLLYLP